MLNFSELKNRVGVLVQRSDDSDYLSKIGVWLNLSQELLAELYDYWIELQETYNFDTEGGKESYPMPKGFIKPLRIFDLTNKKKMDIMTEEQYIDEHLADISEANEDAPIIARYSGVSGTRVQVSSSGKTLQLKSSSTSDTASVVGRIRGYIDSDRLIEDFEDITVTAATPTTYKAGTKTFYEITHFSKSADTIGYLTLADADDTVLEYLAPLDRVATHKILKLGKIPDDTYSMRTLFKKKETKMVDDNDYPFTECDNYLILDAWGMALSQEKETMERAVTVWNKALAALNAILAREAGNLGPDYTHKLKSGWLSAHRNRRM